MKPIDPASWVAQPWKNGRGTTLEILRWPAGAADADYDVRVSIARIDEGGAFSQFPGYRRHSFLVSGVIALNGIDLVAPGEHVVLPGEQPIEAVLPAGPARLLNVLARVPLDVGRGPIAHPVRFVFDLDTDIAQLADEPERVDTDGCVWIA